MPLGLKSGQASVSSSSSKNNRCVKECITVHSGDDVCTSSDRAAAMAMLARACILGCLAADGVLRISQKIFLMSHQLLLVVKQIVLMWFANVSTLTCLMCLTLKLMLTS